MEQRAWYMLVKAHNTLCRRWMLLFDMVPDDDFVHQLFFGVTVLFVVTLGAR
jgi:hypothetical protein